MPYPELSVVVVRWENMMREVILRHLEVYRVLGPHPDNDTTIRQLDQNEPFAVDETSKGGEQGKFRTSCRTHLRILTFLPCPSPSLPFHY